MVFFRGLLVTLLVIHCILIILLVLVQKSKGGGGMGTALGGSVGESIFGSRAGNFLTKVTWTLSTSFLILTLVLSIMYSNSGRRPAPQPAQPAQPAPAQPAPAQPAAPASSPATPPVTPAAPAPSAPGP